MGWLWLAGIGAAAFAALWLLGVGRGVKSIAAAALLFGAAGYAWQQHAALSGHPVTADAEAIQVDPGLAAYRAAIMSASPADQAALAAADDRQRAGDTGAAAQGLWQAIAQRPTDAALWAGYGGAIATHDGGQLSPAALFAFRRAFELAPESPGPPFLLGLSYLQAGEVAAAKAAWLRALSLTPPGAPTRLDLAERLAMIDQVIAMQAATKAP